MPFTLGPEAVTKKVFHADFTTIQELFDTIDNDKSFLNDMLIAIENAINDNSANTYEMEFRYLSENNDISVILISKFGRKKYKEKILELILPNSQE